MRCETPAALSIGPPRSRPWGSCTPLFLAIQPSFALSPHSLFSLPALLFNDGLHPTRPSFATPPPPPLSLWLAPRSLLLAPGILVCLDGYMNVALEQTEEYVDGTLRNRYGDATIRGNNVLYISTGKKPAGVKAAPGGGGGGGGGF